MLRIELRKVFNTKLLYVSIVLGCVSCLLGLISYGEDVAIYRQVGREELISSYQCWLNCLAMGSSVYRLILPVLIIPYIDSYYVERTSGYQNFVVSRCGRSRYFFSKWFAGICSVAVVIFLTLGITMLVCFALYPENIPMAENTYINYPYMKEFFIEKPVQLIMILFATNIILSMIYYTLGFGVSCHAKNRYEVILAPVEMYFLNLLLSQFLNVPALSPIAVVAPFALGGLSLNAVLCVAGALTSIALLSLMNCYRKDIRELP